MNFEYRVEVIENGIDRTHGDMEIKANALTEILNRLGSEGWEVIAILDKLPNSTNFDSWWKFLLKREVER